MTIGTDASQRERGREAMRSEWTRHAYLNATSTHCTPTTFSKRRTRRGQGGRQRHRRQGGYPAGQVVALLLLLARLVHLGRVVDELTIAHLDNEGLKLAVARQGAAYLQHALHGLLPRREHVWHCCAACDTYTHPRTHSEKKGDGDAQRRLSAVRGLSNELSPSPTDPQYCAEEQSLPMSALCDAVRDPRRVSLGSIPLRRFLL